VRLAAKRYATDADVLLAAVQSLAGPSSGGVLGGLSDKAALAVNTLAVIQVLFFFQPYPTLLNPF
jgi:hypothetical protein